jgi:hypothetical protein
MCSPRAEIDGRCRNPRSTVAASSATRGGDVPAVARSGSVEASHGRRRMSSSASRSCWWRRLRPAELHASELASRPAASSGWPAARGPVTAQSKARRRGLARRAGLNRGARLGVSRPDAEAWRCRTPVESRRWPVHTASWAQMGFAGPERAEAGRAFRLGPLG